MADAGKKVVEMKLKVDLQCNRCFKKVKKILSKLSQIRGELYDEKQNVVIIKVVSCNPEKLRHQILCKGCGVITSIKIKKETPPPPPPPSQAVLVPGYPIYLNCWPGPYCDGWAFGRPIYDRGNVCYVSHYEYYYGESTTGWGCSVM